MKETLLDTLLSILLGILLLGAVHAAYSLGLAFIPDDYLISNGNPLLRLALARMLLFALLAFPLGLVLAWPLHRIQRADLAIALPGASCATVLFVLLEQWQMLDPFPSWFTVVRALILFAVLPIGWIAWRRFAR